MISYPILTSSGAIIGKVIANMAIAETTMPKKKYTIKKQIRMTTGGTGKFLRNSASSIGIWETARKRLKMIAPTVMIIISAEVSAVSRRAAGKLAPL
jgi:hypothetical protein